MESASTPAAALENQDEELESVLVTTTNDTTTNTADPSSAFQAPNQPPPTSRSADEASKEMIVDTSDSLPNASPAFTRSKRKRRDGDNTNSTSNENETDSKRTKATGDLPPQPYAEAYVQIANQMIFTMEDKTRQLMDSLDLPGNALSGLGYLKSGLRTPTVLEQWSPWEIGLFQAALAHHGKQFHLVQKEVQSKSVQEVLDFYLVWKKTSAYKQWKSDYLPPYLDTDDEEEAETTIATTKK